MLNSFEVHMWSPPRTALYNPNNLDVYDGLLELSCIYRLILPAQLEDFRINAVPTGLHKLRREKELESE